MVSTRTPKFGNIKRPRAPSSVLRAKLTSASEGIGEPNIATGGIALAFFMDISLSWKKNPKARVPTKRSVIAMGRTNALIVYGKEENVFDIRSSFYIIQESAAG